MNKKNSDFILVVPLLIIGALVIYHKIIDDFMRQDFRAYLFVINSIYKKTLNATGTFPLWQNYQMCGISYIVNNPFLFSISRLLTLLGFSSVFAWVISEYIFMIAGVASFYLLMRLYRCSRYVSLFGALMFLFFLYRIGTSECYPAALAAIIFFMCEKYDKVPKFLYIAIGAVSIGITCLSGIIQGILFVLVLQILLVGYFMINKIQRSYCIASVSSWGLGFVLSFSTLLPQMRDVGDSQRLFYDMFYAWFKTSLLPFNFQEFLYRLNALMLMRLSFPVSLICCILAILAFFYIREKKLSGLYFISSGLVFLYISLSFTQPLWRNFPLIGRYIIGSDFTRAICAIGFIVIFFAAFTINSLINRHSLSHNRILVSIVSLIIVILCGFICLPYLSKGSILIRSGIFLFIITNLYLKAKVMRWTNFIFSILLLSFLAMTFLRSYSLTSHLMKQNNLPMVKSVLSEKTLEESMDLLPGEVSEVKKIIVDILKESSLSQHFRSIDIGVHGDYQKVRFLANRIYSPFGMANIYPLRYYEFFKWLIDDLRTKSPEKYKSYIHFGAYTYGTGASYNENLLSLAGVKWILVPNDRKETRFKKIQSGNRYSLYLNEKVFPRAFPVFGLDILKDKEEMAEFMMSRTTEDFSKSVPILAEDAAGLMPDFLYRNGMGSAKIIRYNPNEVLIDVDFSENGLLVLTDNFHKSWKVTLDNVPIKIYPAYYTFRMAQVPKGKHIVRFYIVDKLFIYSSFASLSALVGMILGVIFEGRF